MRAWPFALVLLLPAPTASATVSAVHVSYLGDAYAVTFASDHALASPVVAWQAGAERGQATATARESPGGADTDVVYSARLPARALTYAIDGRSFEVGAPPASKDRVRVAFVADMGRSEDAWRVLRAIEAAKPDLVIFGGDLSYANGVPQKWDEWFAHVEPLVSTVPTMTARGNHETLCYRDNGLYPCRHESQEYVETFAMPGGSRMYYAFDWGPARFVALDTEAYHPSDRVLPTDPAEQKAFLEHALAEREGAWSIAFFHRPLWSSNLHDEAADGDAHDDLVPVLVAGGADIALTGHSHAYERSWAMRGDEVAVRSASLHEGDGLVQITSGGGGRSLYTEFEEPAPAWSAKRAAEWEFVLLDITPDRLLASAIRPDGSVLDRVVLVREGADAEALPDLPDEAAAGRDVPAAPLALALVAIALAARRLRAS